MDEIPASRGLVQRVDILCNDNDLARMLRLETRERIMRSVGPCGLEPAPAEIVELVQRAGFRAKPSGVATSSRLKRVHSPSLPRKVPSPLSAESPAPVNTMLRKVT
jgi:hypothetical protein